MSKASLEADLHRIHECLRDVESFVSTVDLKQLEINDFNHHGPSTSLDKDINQLIFSTLLRDGEGWLSEDTDDSGLRLECSRVWVVDPVDGTRELLEGLPEWSVSIGLVVDRKAVAGGILNPATGEMFWGALGIGVYMSGDRITKSNPVCGGLPHVLVSRKEYRQGDWGSFERIPIAVEPVGSIAYRLARVATGYAFATCTFEPRNEWDVAGGVSLLLASGGRVEIPPGGTAMFNQRDPRFHAFCAYGNDCPESLIEQVNTAYRNSQL
jgi:myo-inositol-1(or 4)-monophosphatase